MRDQTDLVGVLVLLIIVGSILFTGAFVLNEVASATDTDATTENATRVTSTVLLDGTNTVAVDGGEYTGTNETVVNSRGFAVSLTGASDSYLESTSGLAVGEDDTWTVSTFAAADSASATEDMTVLTIGGQLVVTYNGSAAEWRAWYYDDGTGRSYELTAAAPDQPSSLTQVMIVRNGSDLTLYRNATPADSADLAAASAVDAPLTSGNWHGRLDETETADDALSASERNQSVDSPNAPLAGTNRTARIMYDEPARSQQRIFFATAALATSNVSYVDGLAGQTMDGSSITNDLTLQTDYQWDTDGPLLKPVGGRELDGAPVAYVEYDRYGAGIEIESLTGSITSALQLAGLLFILAPLGVIIAAMAGIRDGR